MNKLKKQIEYAKFTENSVVCLDIDYAERLLLELVEQYETPTLEEVKKEWEELGYKLIRNGDFIELLNKVKEEVFIIDTKHKQYSKTDDRVKFTLYITLEEHQLLHKLFEIWGWFDE